MSRAQANAYTLLAVLLLFGGIVGVIAACGGNDLTFPGNIPATPTSQFTATPEPEET